MHRLRHDLVPEPVLKSKQPMPFETATAAAVVKQETADADLAAEDLVIDEDEEPSADEEVDLATGDDDLGVATGGRGRRSDKASKLPGRSKFPLAAGNASPKGAYGLRSGAVAQLGERRNGIAKVRGSIPLGSTNLRRWRGFGRQASRSQDKAKVVRRSSVGAKEGGT